MQIFPAIDIKDGKAVRLTQGDYDKVNVYYEKPEEVAVSFAARGAKNLHAVDLDGARDGTLANFAAVENIIKKSGLFVEVGGGIRDEARIQKYLAAGASRVILGTAAAENFAFLEDMVQKYGDKIAVGVDARDGKLAVKGWLEATDIDSVEFCKKLEIAGVKTVIYTDIAKDGAMSGTNLEIYERLAAEVKLNIIASGGISSAGELEALKRMGVHGAIVGKALYTNTLTLEEVLAIC